MGFFATSLSSSPVPTPLGLERLADVLESDDIRVGYSEDHTRLGGYFDDHLAEFVLYGEGTEVLQVRVHWGCPLGVAQRAEMLELLNAQNSEKVWPKCYVDVEDDDLYVLAEHTVDYEHGVTDAQLLLHVRCAISSALSAFRRLDEAFPDAAAARRAANPEPEAAGIPGT